jgi:hypothetical protein
MWLAVACFGLPSPWSPSNSILVVRTEFRFGSSSCDRICACAPTSYSTTSSTPPNPDAWIASARRRLWLNCIPTVWRGGGGGFCLGRSWKPFICSQKDRRKPLIHDSRSGFSAGPRRSVHTALIRALSSLHPDVPVVLHVDSLSNTPLRISPVFFLDQQTFPFTGPS